ncbi:lipocalin family protein [Methylocystis echinoides]|uniref:lipocalin family protein n=1 Tax=Methylocystis echinoides TaxID=29468 RepID=UPI00343BDCCF
MMKTAFMRGAAVLALVLGGACGAVAQAPSVKPIDPARFYKGAWLEVARRPMWITDGCVAGTTSYARGNGPNEILVRDACRKGAEEVALTGAGAIQDPGVNSRLSVRYNPLLSVDYHIVDVAPDYSWFIGTSPTLDNLFIYTRQRPSAARLQALVARAQALGYDTSTLEFPWNGPRR